MRAPLAHVHNSRTGHGGDVSTEWVDDWTTRAACRGVDRDGQDRFHPPIAEPTTDGAGQYSRGSGWAHAAYADAQRFCRACPVRVTCLEFAMRTEGRHTTARHGMWGGTTPRQRRALADIDPVWWPALTSAAARGRTELFRRLVERAGGERA